jgi:hypothetical protein
LAIWGDSTGGESSAVKQRGMGEAAWRQGPGTSAGYQSANVDIIAPINRYRQ